MIAGAFFLIANSAKNLTKQKIIPEYGLVPEQ